MKLVTKLLLLLGLSASLSIVGPTAYQAATDSEPAVAAAGCGRWINASKGYSYCSGQYGSQRARLECRHVVSPHIKTWRYGPWKSRTYGALSITSPCPSGYNAYRVYTEYSSQW